MIEPSERLSAPTWPAWDDLDPSPIAFSYDRDSDILLVHFDERGPAAAVDYVGDYLAVLVDVGSGEPVGLQIEDFLGHAVVEEPQRIDLLEVAELRGIIPAEVAALRGSVDVEARRRSALAVLLRDLCLGGVAPSASAAR